jgi:PAS domain S-box-containing protein
MQPVDSGRTHQITTRSLWVTFWVVLIVVSSVAAASFWVQRVILEREAKAQLLLVTNLKVAEIESWMTTHRTFAMGLGAAVTPALKPGALVQPGQLPHEERDRWQNFITSMKRIQDYQGISLISGKAVRLLTTQPAATPLDPVEDELLTLVRQTGKPEFSTIHHALTLEGHPQSIVLIVPVREKVEQGAPLGFLEIRIDPCAHLFPILSRWPYSARTSESLLAERHGDDAVFLTGLQFRKPSAVNYRVPMSNKNVLAVQALSGSQGLLDGVDYRGAKVLGVGRSVPGTQWAFIAKQDRSELLWPLIPRTIVATMGLSGMILGLFTLQKSRSLRRRIARDRDHLVQFQSLFESLADAVLVIGPDRKFLMANKVAMDRLGYTLDEIRQLGPEDINPPDAANLVRDTFEHLNREGSVTIETHHLRKDGSRVPVEIRSNQITIAGERVIVSVARDITDRLRHQAELQRQMDLYAALSQVNQAIVWSTDRASLLKKVCEVMVLFGGFRAAWVAWRALERDRIIPVASSGVTDAFLEEIVRHSQVSQFALTDTAMAIRDGRPCIVDDVASSPAYEPSREIMAQEQIYSSVSLPIRDGRQVAGALTVYAKTKGHLGAQELALLEEAAGDIGFALDHFTLDSRRKEAEASLRDSEFFFKESQRAAAIGSYKADFQADIWRSSPVLDQIFGIDDDYIRSIQGWMDLVHPEDQAGMAVYLQERVIAGGEPFNCEYRIIRKNDQAIRWVRGQGEGVKDASGTCIGLIGTIQDITEQRATNEENAILHAQLIQSQKMESLGTLAGGIAHDMNNILAAIFASTQTLRSLHPELPGLDRTLDIVERAATRGRDLVKRLVGFARKDLGKVVECDPNELVRQEVDLLDRTLMQRYRLVMDLAEPLPAVLADQSALGSALMNLCLNAVDAMPKGGTLTIRTRKAGVETIEIAVEDTGEGMSPETLAKAVEPFYTTKEAGKGTGLGLTIVFNTAKAHGGAFFLRSKPGQGTQATLRLPCLLRTPEKAPATHLPVQSTSALNILMVDDDELLRESVPPMLTRLGHQTTVVPGGREALDQLDAGHVPDLVVLDLNMPDMDGMETLRGIRARQSALPVLLATGYLDEAATTAIAADPHTVAIAKPFSSSEIQRQIDALYQEDC